MAEGVGLLQGAAAAGDTPRPGGPWHAAPCFHTRVPALPLVLQAAEAPRAEAPKFEAPKFDMPKFDMPKVDLKVSS